MRKLLKGIESRWGEKKGFAIILVAGLAAMVLLLGVSLVSFMQVESAVLSYEQRMTLAQNNARMALDMAVGDLQRYLGKDTAVSATADYFRDDKDAEILGDMTGVEEPFWTGAWYRDPGSGTVTGPTWLVTRGLDGTGPVAPNLAQPSTNVKLVGSGTAQHHIPASQYKYDVTVPLMPVTFKGLLGHDSSTVSTIGNYGYWVGDLGVKSSFAQYDEVSSVVHDEYADPEAPSVYSDFSRDRLKQMYGQYPGHDLFDPNLVMPFVEVPGGDDLPAQDMPLVIDRSLSDFQYREAVDGAYTILNGDDRIDTNGREEALSFYEVRNGFHSRTMRASGVMSDSLNGGLRRDLSSLDYTGISDYLVRDPTYSGIDLSGILDVRALLADGSTVGLNDERIYTMRHQSPRISPIFTEFHVTFSCEFREDPEASGNYNLYMGYIGTIELWNPYTSGIISDGQLEVELQGLPVLTFSYDSGGVTIPSINLDAVDVTGDPDEPPFVFNFYTPISVGDISFEPGQVLAFHGGHSLEIVGSGESTELTEILLAAAPAFVDSTPASLDGTELYSLDGSLCEPTLTLKDDSGNVLAEQSIELSITSSFYEFSFEDQAILETDVSYPMFGFSWSLAEPSDAGWVAFDPRTAELSSGYVEVPDRDPLALASYSFNTADPSLEFFVNNFSGSTDYDVGFNKPIFELPRQDIISMGMLQHAEVPSGVRGHIGMRDSELPSGEGSINRVFDSYFFSTIPQDIGSSWTITDPLPNTRIRFVGGVSSSDVLGYDSADSLLVDGVLNINSTSITAWEDLLYSLRLDDWYYFGASSGISFDHSELDESVVPPESIISPNAVFPHYSHSAQETWAGGSTDEQNAYRKGLIEVSPNQLSKMAKDIVDTIRKKIDTSGPYMNLAEFIDAGVIDDAIASTTALVLEDEINAGMSREQPGYLTQADVLTAIAPFLSARSDTFLVRAYGDSVDPSDSTKVWARAYCEAIVQRMPQKHSSEPDSDPMTNTTALGRQFKIVAFRWMDANEI